MFISLNVEPETPEAANAAADELRAELEANGVPVKEGAWGYRLLVIDDPDGNQFFFNYSHETAVTPPSRYQWADPRGSQGWRTPRSPSHDERRHHASLNKITGGAPALASSAANGLPSAG